MEMPKMPKNASRLYASLKKQVEQSGLLRTTKMHYTLMTILSCVLISGAFALAIWSHNIFGLVIGSVLFTVFALQFGFIGHDAAHRCISKNSFVSAIFGQLSMSYILGLSYHAWFDRHNQHHINPNDEEEDPDLQIAFSYSERHAQKRTGLLKLTTKYQDYLLYALTPFIFYFMRVYAVRDIIKEWKNTYALDLLMILGHIITFIALPIYFAGFWKALVFYIIWCSLAGVYFGLVFMPNHLGMPTTAGHNRLGFMAKQLGTSRDIRCPRIMDYLYGGLNYQIEHHLFPTMPRARLPAAKKIVKDFCRKHKLFYYEQNVPQTYKGLVVFSRKIGLSLRRAHKLVMHAMQ